MISYILTIFSQIERKQRNIQASCSEAQRNDALVYTELISALHPSSSFWCIQPYVPQSRASVYRSQALSPVPRNEDGTTKAAAVKDLHYQSVSAE